MPYKALKVKGPYKALKGLIRPLKDLKCLMRPLKLKGLNRPSRALRRLDRKASRTL